MSGDSIHIERPLNPATKHTQSHENLRAKFLFHSPDSCVSWEK